MKKSSKKLIQQIVEIRKEKGLNGLYSFLKKNDIPHEWEVYNFGLSGSKQAEQAKREFLAAEPLNFHYYSIGITSKKSGMDIID